MTHRRLGGGLGVGDAGRAGGLEDFRRMAFGELDLVYTVAFLIAGSREVAVDLLPGVVVSAYRGWEERPEDRSARVWLIGLLLDALDGRHRGPVPSGASRTAAVVSKPGERLAPVVVRQAITELPGNEREVLVLCEVAALSYSEAARVLRLGRGELRTRLYAARATLHRRLMGREPVTTHVAEAVGSARGWSEGGRDRGT